MATAVPTVRTSVRMLTMVRTGTATTTWTTRAAGCSAAAMAEGRVGGGGGDSSEEGRIQRRRTGDARRSVAVVTLHRRRWEHSLYRGASSTATVAAAPRGNGRLGPRWAGQQGRGEVLLNSENYRSSIRHQQQQQQRGLVTSRQKRSGGGGGARGGSAGEARIPGGAGMGARTRDDIDIDDDDQDRDILPSHRVGDDDVDSTRALVLQERNVNDHPPLVFEKSVSTSSRVLGIPSPKPTHTDLVPTYLPTTWDPNVYERSTPLWEHLYHYIVVTGRPISFATYMRWCLTHPDHGYYNTRAHHNGDLEDDDLESDDEQLQRHVIGRDFVTSPEISSLFGECLAVWFASWLEHNTKEDSDRNSKYRWVECGPGRGTLIRDLLVASAPLNLLDRCQSIHLIEASPVLRHAQKQVLEELSSALPIRFRFEQEAGREPPSSLSSSATATPEPVNSSRRHEITVVWHDALTDVIQRDQQQILSNPTLAANEVVTFGICQEFVDALPVYSFQKTHEGWRERMVDLAMEDDENDNNNNNNNEDSSSTSPTSTRTTASSKKALKPRLRVVLAPEVTPPVRTLLQTDDHGWREGEDPQSNLGSIVEVNPEGILLVRDMAALIKSGGGGGAALVIDYGGEGSGDSIRAYSRHEQLDFLSLPGLVDVTADVDFAALQRAVNDEPHRHRTSPPNLGTDSARSRESDASSNLSVRAYGPVPQGQFLLSMGLRERVLAEIEDDDTDDDHAENLYLSMVRLADPEHLGERFKVLAMVSHDDFDGNPEPPPPGFPPTA